MKTVAFYTLGCKVNQYETEAMGELFNAAGYLTVDSEENANVYVINTCTVTNIGDRKSRQFVRKAKKINPEAIIAVVGCYSQTAPEEVMAIEGVNIVLGTNERNKIVEYVEKIQKENSKINAVKDIMEISEFEALTIGDILGKTRAFLKIQEGCNQYCTYCIIPYARGNIRSRKIHDIKAEVERLVQNNFKEIVLTGIHVASYGKDIGDICLLDVIDSVHDVKGIERIRLSSIEPTIMTDEFIDRLSQYKKVCPHFHLSLQSGCDTTLKRMNRKYTTKDYKAIVDAIRSRIPEVSLTTDIMVGFPGETEDEFLATREFIKTIQFSQIHVFKYSPRKGTPAASYENQVPSQVKNKRSEELIELSKKIMINHLEKFLNHTKEVLFETEIKDKGLYEGLTDNYIRVLCHSSDNIKGKLLPVVLTELEGDDSIKGHLV
ncbi:MAG: tRNA (N(6)-L-threonylcarbamoyladenosine(37)-C(2))-methylthiotransferase MtaB [Alkaliphilus sp.]|nr:tRNA (N(6)-L-threonylcarbamoyladenosine(37)-C(2))-methylthiotransferase MtaB [Alkaliphilus sp.]